MLPVVSKIFERVLQQQLATFSDKFMSPIMCGYRRGHNPQLALIALIEKWRVVLDKRGYAGAMLMDLSKAFDSIDHSLLITKLHAYGVTRGH